MVKNEQNPRRFERTLRERQAETAVQNPIRPRHNRRQERRFARIHITGRRVRRVVNFVRKPVFHDVDRIPTGRFPSLVDRVRNEFFAVLMRRQLTILIFKTLRTRARAVAQNLAGSVLRSKFFVRRRVAYRGRIRRLRRKTRRLRFLFFVLRILRILHNITVNAGFRFDERANRQPTTAVVRAQRRAGLVGVAQRGFVNALQLGGDSLVGRAFFAKLFFL